MLGEYLWLEKYLYLKYQTEADKYIVYNTEEFARTGKSHARLPVCVVNLYYQFIHPGITYMYNLIRHELERRNDSIITSMSVETALLVVLSLGAFLFVWVPYMRQKKKEVSGAKMIGIAGETQTAAQLCARQGHRQGGCHAQILRADTVQAEELIRSSKQRLAY